MASLLRSPRLLPALISANAHHAAADACNQNAGDGGGRRRRDGGRWGKKSGDKQCVLLHTCHHTCIRWVKGGEGENKKAMCVEVKLKVRREARARAEEEGARC